MKKMPGLFCDDFDLFEDAFNSPWFDFPELRNAERKLYGHRAKNVMCTDIRESDTDYTMEVDLPGFTRDEVRLELKNGYLTVSASKTVGSNDAEREEKKEKYLRHERYEGACSRSYYVGDALTTEDIKASFKHGILTVSIPKKEERLPDNRKLIAIEG